MRIVITSNYKFDSETGTAHIAEALSYFLSKKHHVTYICLGDKYSVNNTRQNLTIVNIPSIEINSVSIPFITPDIVYKIFVYLHEFEPKVIHSQNSLFISNLVQIWANLNNVPFVVTFHHIPTEAIKHLFPKLTKNILTSLVQDLYKDLSLKKFLNNTDKVIALNNFVYKSIRSVDKNIPIQIINNGLDLSNLIKIKRKENISKNIFFVFVGSYNARKNQEFLIKTFSYLPHNYILNLHGDRETGVEYAKKLDLLSKKLNLKNVFINDYSKDINKIYKKSAFFISASLKEAQCLAVIEALASGVPVIGLKNETTDELINGGNGLVFSKRTSPKKFAAGLVKFIGNINYLDVSKNAKKSIDKFNIKKVVLKIENLYESTTCSDSKNSRRNIGKYYQEIFKRVVVKK